MALHALSLLYVQNGSDAAECYEKSWAFGHQAEAAVGFKLAFNYLKARRYVVRGQNITNMRLKTAWDSWRYLDHRECEASEGRMTRLPRGAVVSDGYA